MRVAPPPLYWPPADQLPQEEAEVFTSCAGNFWEKFYRQHRESFFKDRHYLEREFPDLGKGAPAILEVGCGVGNTAFPLVEGNPRATVYACDFSPTAIDCVKQHPRYSSGQVKAFVADITKDRLADTVPTATVDICTMVFVLSAISPDHMPAALRNVAEVMRPGGSVVVRDYAAGDMAEGRFRDSARLKCLGPRFYVRGDGTCAYYFTEAELAGMFEGCGFDCVYVKVQERVVENNALEVRMDRRWIQAKFRRRGGSEAGTARHLGVEAIPAAEGPESEPAEVEWAASRDDTDDLQELFSGEHPPETVEEEYEICGAGRFTVQSLSREHKHTLLHTGLMLWDSSLVFARYLAASPHLLNRKQVLEVGCGCNPLCLLALLRHARRVVSSDGSPTALQRLAANISLNASKVLVERARLRRLSWGDEADMHRLATEYPGGFDLILGADVVYAAEFVPQLFQTAAALISSQPDARLLLCHITRRVDEARILSIAGEAGFVQTEVPPPDAPGLLPSGLSRLLCFRLTGLHAQPLKPAARTADSSDC